MTSRQRLAYVVVALVVAVAAFLLLRDGGDSTPEQAATPGATATPEPTVSAATPDAEATPTPTPTPRPSPPLLTAGDERELTVRQGETVAFRVRHDTDEEVHVHGYDISRDLPAGETVTVRFEADITGIFEIELEGSHTLLARLEVRP